MTIRSQTRNALFAASTALGAAGIFIVANLGSPANNIGLDCVLPDGGVGIGYCNAILEPPVGQCSALMIGGGNPPSAGLDAGFPNAQVKLSRVLDSMVATNVIQTYHCEGAILDAGVVAADGGTRITGSPACWCEIRGSLIRYANGALDGQAPGWRDAIDANALGSIIRPGKLSLRPAWAKRGGCRAHGFFGENLCAASIDLDGGPGVDGGP